MGAFDLTRTSTFKRDFHSNIDALTEYLKTASVVDLEVLKYEAKKFDEPAVQKAVLTEEQNRKDANSLF